MKYSNSQMVSYIEEYIHSERDREVLKRYYIDGLSIEKLSAEFNYSTRHMFRIVDRARNELMAVVREMS